MERVAFVLNGSEVKVEVEEKETLLYTLRERLRVRSVKEGCGIGECGACTVLIDDRPFYSCLVLSSKVRGRHVKTVEYLGREGLHPLQEAFIEHGAVQCGFCTPGMLLSAYALLLREKQPTVEQVKRAISGNLCRCTGYLQIVEAVKAAAPRVTDEPEPVALREGMAKEEVLDRLDKGGFVVYAGGTDLMVKYRQGEVLGPFFDIASCEALRGTALEGSTVRIGALSTHAEVAEDETVRRLAPALASASGSVGSPQIMNLGTLGGNIVNASPAADTLPALLVHDAECVVESKGGMRVVPLEELVVGPYRTALRKGELLTEVRIKGLEGYREGFIKVAKRAALVISRLSLAYAVKERGGFIEDIRLSVGAMTPTPFRARGFEEVLRGKQKERDLVDRACRVLFDEITRVSGMRPSYRYKFPVLRDLVFKVLEV